MSRLNWIVQRSTNAELRSAPGSTRCGNWRDCHNTGSESEYIANENSLRGLTTDAHGNKGFQNKKKARAELDRLRKKFPHDSYRLIKITE